MSGEDVTQFLATPGVVPPEDGPVAHLDEAKTPCVGVGFVGHTLFGDGQVFSRAAESACEPPRTLCETKATLQKEQFARSTADSCSDAPLDLPAESDLAARSIGFMPILRKGRSAKWELHHMLRSASPRVAGSVGAVLGISLALGMVTLPRVFEWSSSSSPKSAAASAAPSAVSRSLTQMPSEAPSRETKGGPIPRHVPLEDEAKKGENDRLQSGNVTSGTTGAHATSLAPVAPPGDDSARQAASSTSKEGELSGAARRDRTLLVLKEASALVKEGKCAYAADKYRSLRRGTPAAVEVPSDVGASHGEWWATLDFEPFAKNALAYCAALSEKENLR